MSEYTRLDRGKKKRKLKALENEFNFKFARNTATVFSIAVEFIENYLTLLELLSPPDMHHYRQKKAGVWDISISGICSSSHIT